MSLPPPSIVSPSDIVLKLVESVGRPADADFYVQLFRKLPKTAFAIVAPGASCLDAAQRLMVEHLRFLHHLGLHSVVVLGLFQPERAQEFSPGFAEQLRIAGLAVNEYDARAPKLAHELERDLSRGQTPIVFFPPGEASTHVERFEKVGSWAALLRTRKLVLVRAQGGLGPQVVSELQLGPHHRLPTTEKGISVVNLQRDLQPLLLGNCLNTEDQLLLTGIDAAMHEAAATLRPLPALSSEQLMTSVTSPTNLLHELFTVKGAGTLVKSGAKIERHTSYAQLDTTALTNLLETTFERKLCSTFFDRPATAIYLESEHRGAAIVREGLGADFLTKFVVGRLAQGLGLGRDLWESVTAHHPQLYWRSRPNNPIIPWYESQCDGRAVAGDWIVYWRGISTDTIPGLIRSAVAQPVDFEPHPEATVEDRNRSRNTP